MGACEGLPIGASRDAQSLDLDDGGGEALARGRDEKTAALDERACRSVQVAPGGDDPLNGCGDVLEEAQQGRPRPYVFEHEEAGAGPHDAHDFAERDRRVRDRAENEGRDDRVEARRRKGEGLGRRGDEVDARPRRVPPGLGLREHPELRIDRNHTIDTVWIKAKVDARPRADFEDPTRGERHQAGAGLGEKAPLEGGHAAVVIPDHPVAEEALHRKTIAAAGR